ncbi:MULTISPECIES: hypothetical protein [Methylomonas]|uniref:Uncharacterized protein n=2 Tax=Methylomonas TaxID=416 RepID=A0A126T0S8_9GAMM|nr:MULTISPECIES: hypothetical protein [Methylomonas]AMK75689.1 hypothetical protein JT25_004190 [Methylomonas denitrificans]OAH98315.1 hypothetical protein A1342_15085 [Methylomonas methanica]TCV82485.1 hypothetical protein EDE11_11380 [Methylomonas methanica]
MSDFEFFPSEDEEFLAWIDKFIACAKPEHGVAEAELLQLKTDRDELNAKIIAAKQAEAVFQRSLAELLQMDWGKPRH